MAERINNDSARLQPVTEIDGPALAFEFDGLQVGVAEYRAGPTGCTVFYFPKGVSLAVDVRGGSAGVIGDAYTFTKAICLVGGSLYGLEATTGVAAEYFAMAGYSAAWQDLAPVAGAIIYDYSSRDNTIYPDKELGRAALRSARPGWFPLGRHGAGCSARVGKSAGGVESEYAGQGAAFRRAGAVRIAAFSVVNAMGGIVDRSGRVVRGFRDPATGEHLRYLDLVERRLAVNAAAPAPASGNTTLTVVATDYKLGPHALRQVGRQIHSSMARAIQPFHGLDDGDVLFMVTTNAVEEPRLDPLALGALASEAAWDAVLASFTT